MKNVQWVQNVRKYKKRKYVKQFIRIISYEILNPMLAVAHSHVGHCGEHSKIENKNEETKKENKRKPAFRYMLFFRAGGKEWLVFYHFVGAVPGSTELEALLRRLLVEMKIVTVS